MLLAITFFVLQYVCIARARSWTCERKLLVFLTQSSIGFKCFCARATLLISLWPPGRSYQLVSSVVF